MTTANDSVDVTPGAGATVATHLVGGKEYQVVMIANDDGHIQRTAPTYMYSTPAAAVGISKLYFDIFNATGSGKSIKIKGIWAIPKTDATVTGAVAIRVDLYRTSTVGTGGTAHSYQSATPDVAGGNICPMDTGNAALPAQVTARWLPAGGAAISVWLFPTYSLGEESPTSMAYISQYQNLVPTTVFAQDLVIPENTGILVKQGTVASAGTIGFLVLFTLE